MQNYLNLMKKIFEKWIDKKDRTWIWTRSIFGCRMEFNLKNWFPLITTKKMFLRGIFVELIWLIRWETNIKYLVDRNVHIRDERPFQNYLKINKLENKIPKYSKQRFEEKEIFIKKIKESDKNSEFVLKYWDLWPVYWHQRRNFGGKIKFWDKSWKNNKDWVDQLKQAVNKITNKPYDRRIIISARNAKDLEKMLLPPCHMFYQFYVDTTNNTLNLQMYQRSADFFLWVPFNIASYSLLLILISQITNLKPWNFIHILWDTHIYHNHFEQVKTQLSRKPYPLPKLKIRKELKNLEDIENLKREDIELLNYQSHWPIKAPIAV